MVYSVNDNQAVNAHSAAQHLQGIGASAAQSSIDPSRYLGPPTGTFQVNPFHNVSYQNYTYPEAVKNSAMLVRNDVEGFILEANEFYTTVCLPWAETDQNTIIWNEWKFDTPLLDRVPEEGVSRMITSKKSEFRQHIVRRGLAFVMEADYMNSSEGREQYTLNVKTISQAVQETQNHDTIVALLSCKTYSQIWMQRFGSTRVNFSQVLDNEKLLFGSVNMPDGDSHLAYTVEEYKRLLKKQKIEADQIISWPGSTIYMSMIPPKRTEYYIAGPDGVRRKEEGPSALTNYRGLNVYEMRDFDVYTDAPPVQLSSRPIQVAEYYTMTFDRRNENAANFTTRERAIVLYDENHNQWQKIEFKDAFLHAKIFGSDGGYTPYLRELVRAYNARGQRPEVVGEDDGDQDLVDRHSPNAKKTFFLAAPDNNGEYMLAKYFGHMELKHMSETDVERIAETIAAKFGVTHYQAEWQDMIRLIEDIESTRYNREFLEALIAANTADNVSADGEFIGEQTPADLQGSWATPGLREWKPNAFGSLNLPQGENMRRMLFPIGFANGPGMLTLAEEARKPTSPWNAVGRRAASAVALVQHIIECLRMRLKSSAVLCEASRPPWFHRPDALTTFFSTVIGVSRHPLFLAALPPSRAAAQGLSSDEQLRQRNSNGVSTKWFALPGLYDTIDFDKMAHAPSEDEIVDMLLGVSGTSVHVVSAPARNDKISFISPTTGNPVTVSANLFTNVFRLTPEMRAIGALPAGNSDRARSVRDSYFRAMHALTSVEDRRKLVDFVFGMSNVNHKRMWNVIENLVTVAEENIAGVVNRLYVADARDERKVRESREEVDRLNTLPAMEDEYSMNMLMQEWQPIVQSMGLSGAQFTYEDVAADMQRILEIERELQESTNVRRNDFSRENAFSQRAADAAKKAAKTERDQQLAAELDRLINRVNKAFQADADNNRVSDEDLEAVQDDYASRAFAAKSGDSVTVDTSPAGIARAQFYRAPLTSSRALLESLSHEFGGRVAKPLILPSDPATAHTSPWTLDGRSPSASPLRDDAHTDAFRTITDINRSNRARALDATPLVSRLHAASRSDAHMHSGADSAEGSSSSMRTLFQEDDMDVDRDPLAEVFHHVDKRQRYESDESADSSSSGGPGIYRGGVSASDRYCEGTSSHNDRYEHTRTAVFAKRWEHANAIANPLVRIAAYAFLMSRCDQAHTWTLMIDNDILTPVNLILWRLSITHNMNSMIMMKGGLETGANLYGGANAAQSDDVISKMVYYHLTVRTKAIVWKEKHVVILENLKFDGYVGGNNTRFITRASELNSEALDRPSIIVTAVGIAEREFPKDMDFTGMIRTPTGLGLGHLQMSAYSSAELYDEIIYKAHERVNVIDPDSSSFFERPNHIQYLASQGLQYKFNHASNKYSRFVEPQGHLKKGMCYPGAAPTLNGAAKSFEPYNFDMVSIE